MTWLGTGSGRNDIAARFRLGGQNDVEKKETPTRREMQGCLRPYIRAVVFGVMAQWAYNSTNA